MRDVLKTLWACCSCYWKGGMGELTAGDKVRCPRCKSDDVMRADGRSDVGVPVADFVPPETVN